MTSSKLLSSDVWIEKPTPPALSQIEQEHQERVKQSMEMLGISEVGEVPLISEIVLSEVIKQCKEKKNAVSKAEMGKIFQGVYSGKQIGRALTYLCEGNFLFLMGTRKPYRYLPTPESISAKE